MKKGWFLLIVFVLLLQITGCQSASLRPVEILTSKQMEGRAPGTDGHALAKEYIIKEFKNMSLMPLEEEYILKGSSEKKSCLLNVLLTVTFLEEKKEFVYGQDFLISFPGEKSKYHFENINLRTLEDPISLIFEDKLMYGSSFYKSLDKPTLRFLSKHENLNWEQVKSFDMEIQTEEQMISPQNVVGVLPGEDRKNALVIGAHYDHLGKFGETVISGALDNASGVDVVISLAKKLTEHYSGTKPPQDIIFVAFDMEECGFDGASAFLNYFEHNYSNGVLLNYDCIGISNGDVIFTNPEVKPFLKETCEEIFEGLLNGEVKTKIVDKFLPSDSEVFKDNEHFIMSTNFVENLIFNEDSSINHSVIHCTTDTVSQIDSKRIDTFVEELFISFFKQNQIFRLFEISAPVIADSPKEVFKDVSFENVKVKKISYKSGIYYGLGNRSNGEFYAELLPDNQKIFFLEYADSIETLYEMLNLGDVPQNIADTKYLAVRFYYDMPPTEEDLLSKKGYDRIGLSLLGTDGKIGYAAGATNEKDPTLEDEAKMLSIEEECFKSWCIDIADVDYCQYLKSDEGDCYLYGIVTEGKSEAQTLEIKENFQRDLLENQEGYENCLLETERRIQEKYPK